MTYKYNKRYNDIDMRKEIKLLAVIYILLAIVMFWGFRMISHSINERVLDFKHSRWVLIDNKEILYNEKN